MEDDTIVENLKKIIRSEGSPQERLKRIWNYLEVIKKKEHKPSVNIPE